MKNWKTTLGGALAGAAYLFFKYWSTKEISGADITLALGLAGIGAVAKDHNVTGGKVEQ